MPCYSNIYLHISSLALLLILITPFHHLSFADDSTPIPADISQVDSWFEDNVKPLSDRKDQLDEALVTAESNAKVIKVRTDGSGDFKTITDAVKSIVGGNVDRVIISIGPGNYSEKIRIERTRKFVTLYGDPKDPPVIVYNGTAETYGTVDSATVIVESDYFTAVNIIFVNSAPRPDKMKKGGQAVAFRLSGDRASIYNCKFHGFQDTLCDDLGKHFFKDCYIEGTVDFIFGNGRSIYLTSELHVIPGDNMAMIAAQARHNANEDTGYSFVHCNVTGTGGIAQLGRAWMPYSRVTYAYTDMSDVVIPEGWGDHDNTQNRKTTFFGEYNCSGPGSKPDKRVGYSKKLSYEEAKRFISLEFIEGSKWLLPPTHVN